MRVPSGSAMPIRISTVAVDLLAAEAQARLVAHADLEHCGGQAAGWCHGWDLPAVLPSPEWAFAAIATPLK
jgi:hypothetical protein